MENKKLIGLKVKLHNRRITLVETKEKTGFIIEFKNLKPNPDNMPSCTFKCINGNLNITVIKLSTEALEALCYAYMKLKHSTNSETFTKFKP